MAGITPASLAAPKAALTTPKRKDVAKTKPGTSSPLDVKPTDPSAAVAIGTVGAVTTRTLLDTLEVNGAVAVGQWGLTRFARLSNGTAIPIASTIIPAAIVAYEKRDDLTSGDADLEFIAKGEIVLAAGKGLAVGVVGGKVGLAVGGPFGAAVGFTVAAAGWYVLGKLEHWTGLDEVIDGWRSPGLLRTALKNLGSRDLYSGYLPENGEEGIVLEARHEDKNYFDPEHGIEIGDRMYSQAQAMAAYLDALPPETRTAIAGLGIHKLRIPKSSDFTPALFQTVTSAAKAFKQEHPATRDLTVRVSRIQTDPIYGRSSNGRATGERISYVISVDGFEYRMQPPKMGYDGRISHDFQMVNWQNPPSENYVFETGVFSGGDYMITTPAK